MFFNWFQPKAETPERRLLKATRLKPAIEVDHAGEIISLDFSVCGEPYEWADPSGYILESQLVEALSDLTNLKRLNVTRCVDIMDNVLKDLVLPALTDLSLSKTAVSDKGLSYLTRLRSLETLHLFNTPITNIGIEHLVQLQNLKHLSVGGHSSANYSSDWTATTGPTSAVLSILRRITTLESLGLRGSQFTDQCVPDLKRMTGLRHLYNGAEMSPEGLTQLKEALPDLEIHG